MPSDHVRRRWDAEAGEWALTVECAYCFEPVYNTGPDGNGHPSAVLLRTDVGVNPFCSRACLDAWLGVDARNQVPMAIAEGVGPDEIRDVIPDRERGYIDWPTRDRVGPRTR